MYPSRSSALFKVIRVTPNCSETSDFVTDGSPGIAAAFLMSEALSFGLEVRILVLRGDARVADKHIEKAGNLYIENYTGFYTLDAQFDSVSGVWFRLYRKRSYFCHPH